MTSFDISDTLAPKSEQLDAIELIQGPRIFVIESVDRGNVEQPINVHLADFPRPWRPSKSMRRVLAFCWGTDASKWVGRSCELFYDPEVTFGREKPGGTRISRLSHIDKTMKVPLLVAQGRSGVWTVEPLPADSAPSAPTSPSVSTETLAKLTAMLRRKGVPEDEWLARVNRAAGGAATALEVLTEEQARRVMARVEKLPDATAPAEPTEDEIAEHEAALAAEAAAEAEA